MVEKENRNNFFTYIWIVFPLLIISYSLYLLIKSQDLALYQKPSTNQIIPYVSFKMILGLFFIIAVLSLKKIQDNKIWLFTIIISGLISRLILIPSVPVLENDYYRYLWDGAVSAHLYNPYKYSPKDIADNTEGIPAELNSLYKEAGTLMNSINHPHIRTIYPVLSQVVFAAAYFLSPWEYWSWKVLLLLFDILLLVVLLKILKQLTLPLILVSIYWLNPIVIHEFFNAAHMDLLALLFVVISLYLMLKKNSLLSVICLALAVGFKLWPVVLLPLILYHYWSNKKILIKLTGIFVGIVFVLFIPVLISNLDKSLGFIIYASKWINNAAFYSIFKIIVAKIAQLLPFSPGCLVCINRVGIITIFLIVFIIILKKQSNDQFRIFNKAVMIIAVLYLISPTQFPWYYTWIVPLLVIRPKISLLLYPLLLPLYQLKYLSEYIIYIEHIPVLILFIFEAKGLIWKNYWLFSERSTSNDHSVT